MTPTELLGAVDKLKPGERVTYYVGNFILDDIMFGRTEAGEGLKKLAYMARVLESYKIILLTSKRIGHDRFEYYATTKKGRTPDGIPPSMQRSRIPKSLFWFAEKVENERRMYLLETTEGEGDQYLADALLEFKVKSYEQSH